MSRFDPYAPEGSTEWINGEPHVRWAVTCRAVLVSIVGAFLGGLSVGILL